MLRRFGFLLIIAALHACSLTQQVQTGDYAYERKQYDVAIGLLSDEYAVASGPVKARKAYLLGRSYAILKDTESAISWFQKAVKNNYGQDAQLHLARSLTRAERYDQAIAVYEDLRSILPTDDIVRRELAVAKQAKLLKASPNPDITISPLSFNSAYADYGPILFDDEYLLFTSDRETATGEADYLWTGNAFSDLFIVHKDGNQPTPFDGLLNTEGNEGSLCLSSDGRLLIYTQCRGATEQDDAYCYLVQSTNEEGIWSEGEVLPFFEGRTSYGQPALIEQDSVLVFAAKREEGKGGYDLYYSLLDAAGWTEPYLMPNTINTAGNEYFPTSDGDTLYFSSDYLPGMGGLDIFKTYLRADGSWSPPLNMQSPINSGEDDFHLIVEPTAMQQAGVARAGYFSSNRPGMGDDDIYRWQRMKPSPQDVEDANPNEEEKLSIYLAGKVITPRYQDPDDPNSEIVGYDPVPNARIEIDGKAFGTDEDGFFVKEVPRNIDMQVMASKSGYLNQIKTITTRDLDIPEGEETYTINVSLELTKIFTGVEITLENIYYDFDKWTIRPDAEPTLKRLAKLLQDNPQIQIDLSSHTDCQGDDEYNEELSFKRARSAVLYISRQGIDLNRLTPVGYGESRLAVNCPCADCSEEEHQANRRTTFTIVEQ